jgi:molybdate transport system substrate-binding protein
MPLRFVSAGAAQGLVAALAAKHAVQVEGSFGAVGAMKEKFLSGDPCDVVILTAAQIAELVRGKRVLVDTASDLGAVATSIAVREGDAVPFVSDAASLAAALRAADALYFPDPAKATAGIHFAGVLEKLGLAAEVASRLKTFPNGATAMRELARARGGQPIGCTQATEILATPGVRLVAPLPSGLDLQTVYTVAVAAGSDREEAARRFVGVLAGDASRPLRAAAGFQV